MPNDDLSNESFISSTREIKRLTTLLDNYRKK